MNLPNYFLADLPPEASLTGALITEACQTLKRNRQQFLIARPTSSIVRLLCEVAAQWQQKTYSFRQLALNEGPRHTGFSRHTIERGIDDFFSQITEENLETLLVQELGHAKRLDAFTASKEERIGDRTSFASGPELLVHIAAGNLPNPTWMSLILGLLTRSAQFVKCARGASFLPRLFAHSLYEADAKLGACLELAEWPGGEREIEHALFSEADCVTATGSDEALADIRQRLPIRVRFLGYGHRVSFGYIAGEMLSDWTMADIVKQAADDIVAWNQLGCLSPHVIYVERGGSVDPAQFAAKLADELATRESAEPRGPLDTHSAAAIQTRRAFYEVRAAHLPGTQLWCSENSTAWTVIFESDTGFQLSCLNRFIYVKEITGQEQLLRTLEPMRGQISTVGLAATDVTAQKLALRFAQWGVTRICPLGKMQKPPLTWRHDGRPALNDLVTWTDWEKDSV
jgi:hypothetical protein